MQKDTITAKRGLVAGIWGTVLIYLGKEFFESGLAVFLFGVPLLGLPWLLFLLSDRSESEERTDGGEAIWTLVGGALLSLFCTLPVALLLGLMMKISD